MREEAVVSAAVVAILASLTAVAMCDDQGKTTSSLPHREEERDQVENLSCGYVVNTDTVHVPAFSDQHHRLMQVHVRTNLQVRTDIQAGRRLGSLASMTS